MDVWLILLMYVAGLALVVAEILLPGIVLGLVGFGALVVATVFGFRYHWGMGVGKVAVALGVVPLLFFWGTRRIRLRTTLSAESGSVGFVKNYAALLGKEGETVTDLRPAGIVRIEGGKVDVVTSGEPVAKGTRVRVVKVEGNRVIVRKI